MYMKLRKSAIAILSFTAFISSFSETQAQNSPAEIHGSFQADGQYYLKDTLIGANEVPEKFLMNAYGDIIFTKGNFKAGVRYEAYQNVLLGYDPRYIGSGIVNRYASYTVDDKIEVTLGNFYEQFGSGLILRAYWEPTLGLDNAFDGIKLKLTPYKGITLKGLVGKQRYFFATGPGLVRGVDGEVAINETFAKLANSKTRLNLGGSFVSKYQSDEDPTIILPENVASWAGRFDVSRGKITVNGEYVYKYNDPSSINKNSYKYGEAILLKSSYSQKGLGILLAGKRIDNMNFRSDRNANLNALLINYLPALSKYHTYSLATIYPYSTQANGELGFEAEVNYTFKKGSPVGGKYGTNIIVNYSSANALDTTGFVPNSDGELPKDRYETSYDKFGDALYKDISVEINKRFTDKIKATVLYANQLYNKSILEEEGVEGIPTVYDNLGVVDITYKLTKKYALRCELQALLTKQDMGDWAAALLELTASPNWFIAVGDQYNFGNDNTDKRIHYYNVNAGYTHNATRIALGYGKQRQGLFCVGGVCRQVPASYGFSISVSTSF